MVIGSKQQAGPLLEEPGLHSGQNLTRQSDYENYIFFCEIAKGPMLEEPGLHSGQNLTRQSDDKKCLFYL